MTDKSMYLRYLVKGKIRRCERKFCWKFHLEWPEPPIYAGMPYISIP